MPGSAPGMRCRAVPSLATHPPSLAEQSVVATWRAIRRARQHGWHTEHRNRHEVKNPKRAGGPETGRPTPSHRETLRTRWDQTLPRRRSRGEVPANQSRRQGEGEQALEGRTPRGHRRSQPTGCGDSTDSSWERSLEGDRAWMANAVRVPLDRRCGCASNVTRAGAPRGVPTTMRGTPCRENPMDAPAPRAPVGMVVYVTKEATKPRTWHAVGGGPPAG